MRGDATGTRYENLAFILGVKVDEHVARHETGLQTEGTGEACFLIHGEEAFDRTVGDVVAVEERQFHRTAYAVVCTQRGAFSLQPLTVNIGLYGVGLEIDVYIHQFVAYHVHMALQHDGGTVLITRCGGLADEHVARLVNLGRKTTLLAKVQ